MLVVYRSFVCVCVCAFDSYNLRAMMSGRKAPGMSLG